MAAQRPGLTQALGLASETSVTRTTPCGLLAMFRAAALALHSPQLTFGSLSARHARFHQALPVETLAPFPGFSRFARRRTRQQALPRVPACECEIFTGTWLGLQEEQRLVYGLTIRSSRVRFAASTAARYD